jgi:hypothetical protein
MQHSAAPVRWAGAGVSLHDGLGGLGGMGWLIGAEPQGQELLGLALAQGLVDLHKERQPEGGRVILSEDGCRGKEAATLFSFS